MADQRRHEFERAALVHLRALARVAVRLCRNRDEANELVQETYLQAWRSFHRFMPGTNCRAWLYKILFCCHAKWARKKMREPALVDIDAAPEPVLLFDPPTPDALTADSVRAAFDKIPEPFRTAVMLVDVEQLTYRDAPTRSTCRSGP